MSDFPNLLEKRNLFNTVSTLEKNGKKDQIYVQDQIKVKSKVYFAYKRDQMISNFSETGSIEKTRYSFCFILKYDNLNAIYFMAGPYSINFDKKF